MVVFLLENVLSFFCAWVRSNCLSRLRAYHSGPCKMADARPTLVHGAAIYAQRSRTVQPPDDRTYSAEVTSFPSNLLHHRSVRIAFPIARRYDTTPFLHCQAQFRGKSQNVGLFLGQKGDLAVCAVGWHFWQLFHGIVKLLVQKGSPALCVRNRRVGATLAVVPPTPFLVLILPRRGRGRPQGSPLREGSAFTPYIAHPRTMHPGFPQYSAAFLYNPLHFAKYAHNNSSATLSPSVCSPDCRCLANDTMSRI